MPFVLPPDLTVPQAAIWLDQQLFAGRPIYNTGQVLAIRGRLRVDLFKIALHDTVAESPHLRLPPRSGPVPLDLMVLDFREEKDPLGAAEQWMRTEMRKAIAMDDPALFRFALIHVGEDHTLWFQKYHHLIIDATGRRLLSARTAARYRTLRSGAPLSVLEAITPEELLDAERRYAASSDHEADRDYWVERFAQLPAPLLDINRRNTERARSGSHARLAFMLKRADFMRLRAAARALGSSEFHAIIALTYAAFARLYDRSDIVVGLELANRTSARLRQVVGLMARPLPILLNLHHGMTIADAMQSINDIRAQTHPHRRFPIQELIGQLGVTRRGQHGLFDVIVNYIPAAYDFAFEDIPVTLTNRSYGFAAPWMVTIADTRPSPDVDVTIDTDSGLIQPDLAARLASCMETLLLRGLDNPACSIAALPIMPEATRAELLARSAGDTVAVAEGATLASLCAAQVERTPDAVAMISGEQQLSFASLHQRAARLAGRLSALGVRPGVVVGIALPRTPDLVVAVLAVHKAGGAYLALDPSYPAERIRFFVADSAAPIILTNAALAPAFADSGARLVFDTDQETVETEMSALVPAGPNDLAYVLYTSGSTGRPKAVGIEHRHLINLVCWGRSIVSDAEMGGLLFSTSLNFDLSAFEMFVPLAFGGCIVMVDNLLALQSAPQRAKVRLINTGPSLLNALLRAGGLPSAVTTVILAGEKLPRRLANSLFEAAPAIRLLNCYGPTETTVYSSWAHVDPAARSEPTIGRAIWNTTLYVLDARSELVPPGAEGELFIGGAGVARGYLGRPELTAERFTPNPYGEGQLYRSGDRVRLRADGELEFLGRGDDQLKINGIRVEPGEIEATLLALPGIAAAVVALHEDRGAHRLVAYLLGEPETLPASEDVRAELEARLPRHMVPSVFVWLDAMPMTPSGKLDRKALPAPPREEAALVHAPQTKLEREISAIWEDLLQQSPIGVRSDFFDLGGDSLALLSLFATVEARFGRRLTVDVLSGGFTIAGLTEILAENAPAPAEMDPLVALQPYGHLPPFFCVHGIGGDVVHLHRLATRMGTQRPFYGLRRTAGVPLTDTIHEIAARYVAAMLARQPAGPFYLGGHSFGATVAYEMASQLEAQGHEIGLLAIIDQRRPGWRFAARQAIPALPRILRSIPARIRDELARVPASGRFRRLGQTLLRWLKVSLGYRTHAASMFNINHGEIELIQMFDANLRALRDYRPKPLRARISLFRAERQLLANMTLNLTLNWSELAEGGVQVRIVPGNHGSIATEPLVQVLAATLRDELDAAQRALHRTL